MKQVRISKLVPSATASLLLLGSLYCWYLLYTRGLFNGPIEIPIHLASGKTAVAHFAVRESGDHEIMIAFPRTVTDSLDKELHEIKGSAMLTGDARRVDTGIPSQRPVWEAAGEVGIFSLPLKRGREYTLLLQISQIPENLARCLGTLRVRQNPNNLLSFLLPLDSTLVLSLLGLLSVPPIWRKAWERKRPFLLIVVVSTAMTIVGLIGFKIPPYVSNSGLIDFIVTVSFACVGAGPPVLILSLASWMLFSVISVFTPDRGLIRPR